MLLHFSGPSPLDKEHTYSITSYTLNKDLNLESGFYLNDLYKEIGGYVLDKATIKSFKTIKRKHIKLTKKSQN